MLFIYLLQARDQYGGNSFPGVYTQKSQQSENIRYVDHGNADILYKVVSLASTYIFFLLLSLIARKPYFIEMFQKKKGNYEHLQVAVRSFCLCFLL
jgi:hypothetical protein